MFERIHEEAFAVEQVHFKKTKKRTNPKKDDPFIEIMGAAPVLVAAPHSVRRMRAGKILRSAENTGSLAWLLARQTGCNALAVKKFYGGDPSSDQRCLYKERLAALASASGVALVIELNGAPRDCGFDLALAPSPSTVSSSGQVAKFSRALAIGLADQGISAIIERTVDCADEHSPTRFSSTVLSVDALRLEINHRFRAPNRNGADFSALFRAFYSAIAAL